MNQIKIGMFLKVLRQEKGITQEELAEKLGISNRSISRWENGHNLPDFDLLIELAKYYQVSIDDILSGERKEDLVDKQTEETMYKVAEYTNEEKERYTKRMHYIFMIGAISSFLYFIFDFIGVIEKTPYQEIGQFGLGLSFGILVTGIIYTSRYGAKIQKAKKRILSRNS